VGEGLEDAWSAYLDTHIAVWLFGGGSERLSSAAKRQIEVEDLLISPMVLLELEYLHARKRIVRAPAEVFNYLNSTFGVDLCHYPFPAVAREAVRMTWTNHPFDRIIVPQAGANDMTSLVTADSAIRRHYKRAVW
jgi:PIN domain nuclease of toxin-antitoxin system